MTGEVTLHGDVLPIGGLKEKLAAAARLGIRKVLIPHANLRSLHDVRKSILERLEIVPVRHMDEVLGHALVPPKQRPSG
jgi:ATP-dependent Lon protease